MELNLDHSGEVTEVRNTPASVIDRRNAVRHTTLLQIATLTGEYYEELCILRDVSSTGLRAESYWPVRQGEPISVEFRTGRRVAGQVVWTDGKMFGVQFDMPVPVAALLDHATCDSKSHVVRRPRIKVSLPAMLRVGLREFPIHICDLSQGGMGIRTDAVLQVDATCDVTLEALGRRRGCIRWYQDGKGGILLGQPLTYPEFGQWRLELAGLHNKAPAATIVR